MRIFINSLLIILLGASFSGTLQAQHLALPMSQLSEHGTNIELLDSLYKNVLDPDPGQTLFGGKGAAYYDAHVKLFSDLGAYLKKNNFSWGQPVRTMTRIYYKKDGSIDYFIYDLSRSGLSDQKQADFSKLINSFLETYSTGIIAGKNFYHRSPYTFKD